MTKLNICVEFIDDLSEVSVIELLWLKMIYVHVAWNFCHLQGEFDMVILLRSY